MEKSSLLIINMQNDYIENNIISIKNPEKDALNLHNFINQNINDIVDIHIIMDYHPFLHVSFYELWGLKTPKILDHNDINNQIENCCFTLNILHEPLKTYPRHCIGGTYGSALNKLIEESVLNWSKIWEYNPILYFNGIDSIDVSNSPLIKDDFNPKTENILIAGETLDVEILENIKIIRNKYPFNNISVLRDCSSYTNEFNSYDFITFCNKNNINIIYPEVC